MGTNFYVHQPACPHCGHAPDPLHIGKSSGGWCFGLHVDENIKCLMDWVRLWRRNPTWIIKNEYNEVISRDGMLEIIASRNDCKRRNLSWHHSIGHGKGTWDLIAGEFC